MKVIVAPEFLIGHPDINAMLQAFYSRSHLSIEDRIIELENDLDEALAETRESPAADSSTLALSRVERIRESLKQYYVNYGHVSIGDCGTITLFIEGVTFLTAKAIQDNPLYRGQETSSRFIDFSGQEDPTFLPPDSEHQHWMNIYRQAVPIMMTHVQAQYPDLSPAGVRPKVFDMVRGLLPVTALTQLSWTGDIRVIREHLARLLTHPIAWVRQDAEGIHRALRERYPLLFGDDLVPVVSDEWFISADDIAEPLWTRARDATRLIGVERVEHPHCDGTLVTHEPLWEQITPATRHLRRYGTVSVLHAVDFGGYRDVQRHRRAYIKSENPMARLAGGYSDWYLEQFPDEVLRLIPSADPHAAIKPLMTRVDVSMTADLEQYAYMISMRTKPSVHPTVRQYFTAVADSLLAHYPALEPFNLFVIDRTETDYDRRARQTIERRPS